MQDAYMNDGGRHGVLVSVLMSWECSCYEVERLGVSCNDRWTWRQRPAVKRGLFCSTSYLCVALWLRRKAGSNGLIDRGHR